MRRIAEVLNEESTLKNPNDPVKEMPDVKLEASIGTDSDVERYQFVRNGYFIKDCHDSDVFNNIVNLKDSWAKENR